MSDALLERLPFKDILIVDFEYCQPDGALPDPLCVVAQNARTGERIARWLDPADRNRALTAPVRTRSWSRTPPTPSACATGSWAGRCRATSWTPTLRRGQA
jgi:hypothetical protein